jgi:hypothetical protein
MGDNGGESDNSGVMAAMASMDAANKAYQLGNAQLQWAKDVWNQQQPLVTASMQAQIDYARQMQAESEQQWQQYETVYAPLEQKFAGEAQSWASPQAMALARGQAMGDVAEAGKSGIDSAAEKLRSYGVNPSSPRYASLFAGAQPMLAASEAAAGTTAGQNLKMQQMQLEGQAIATGREALGASGSLGGSGSQSASGAAQTAGENLTTGSKAMTDPTSWYSAGAQNMNTYVNAVDSYNQSQADFAKANASEMAGFGQAAGSLAGLMKIAKGGRVGFADGGPTDPQYTPSQGGGATGIPPQPLPPSDVPPGGTPGGSVPAHASPSMGQSVDDVPAMLTAHEFVMPKDVAVWIGHKALAQQIDRARQEQQKFSMRDDIGGEPTGAIPQSPNFVSRPQQPPVGANMGGAIPARPMMAGA